MNFISRLFSSPTPSAEPEVRFGRYSDIYKKAERYESWDKSLLLFEEKKYLDAYYQFFLYLGDNKEQNVQVRKEGDKLFFECFQGSKKIIGEANRIQVKAEAKIADATDLKNAVFFRDLLQRNFELEYCRFALDEEKNLTILFDSSTLDGSPFKLYYALREMALQADKQDDLLIERFPSLKPINTGHTEDLPSDEKNAKYKFAVTEIQKTLDTVERLKEDLVDYPGGIAYLLLSLCYRLDYLLTPQGQVTETLERIHRNWFSSNKKSTAEKNAEIIQEFTRLLKRPQSAWDNEFYRIISTFGIVPAFGHDRVENIIDAELPVFDWYAEHEYPEVALAIADFIVGHSQFSFALPKYDRDFFHLYFRVINNDFFKTLGFSNCCYDSEKNRLVPKEIKQQIRNLVKANAESYLSLEPDLSLLKFSNKTAFVRSYLLMVKATSAVQVR